MKKIFYLFSIILTIFSLKVNGQDLLANNIEEYNSLIKNAKPGTTIVLKNGIWKDVNLHAFGNGTKENPIVVKAETAGEVIISGNSTLNIYGEFVIVSGLWFKDGKSSYKSVVQFRKDSKTAANNCRLTNSTISYFAVEDDIVNHWVDIWGKNNRVDHNNFTGKISEGTTLVVWLKGDEHIDNNHIIEYNIFGERPDLGKNGGETIRIGTSENSMKSSKTLVQKNIFVKCDGEIEIISNKSCGNTFRDNLFIGSQGTLTLRHGNNALVEGNVFLGNGVAKTGGIRIINEGHVVRNNLLIGLEGDGFRGPIVVMNGVPNSPLNRYHQVKNVDIQNNTIINSGPISLGEGKDDERSLTPINTNFANNLIFNNTSSENIVFVDDVSGISFKNNYIDGKLTSKDGFKNITINWKEINNIPIPTLQNDDLLVTSKNDKSPIEDITNTARSTFNAGAFNLDAQKLPKIFMIRAGPGWKPNIVKPKIKSEEIVVEPGEETLRKAVGKAAAGATILLKSGEYVFEKSISVNKNIIIIGDKAGTIFKVKNDIEKPLNYFFRLEESSNLKISNVIFDGETSNPKYAIVSPDKNEIGMYNLFADNVVFRNFTNKDGGAIFKAYNGTRADTLSFKNSKFEKSYRGLNLSYDKDVMGFYNANVIILENSVFKDIQENAVNYIRKILSEDFEGGKLIVTNCVFSNVFNNEKGKILKVNGIHAVEITNTVFENSFMQKSPVDLKGKFSFIKNSLIYDSGFVKTLNGAIKENVLYKNPKWEDNNLFIPSSKSPLLKSDNGIDDIGIIKK